ncbi:dipeptide epimerase [Sciscionella sediminilitoris]|uniref:dipeptide epimerase n=1 Tax=Sciscionella sediminilitoris TaxID=1445613 RepID=UPI0004DF34E5|nr:dipeptide epimerase [Sciscionella sp. SE31]
MPITELRTHRVRIPLREPFVTAVRRTEAVEAVLVELRDEQGNRGWGEGTETWRVTGESGAGITAALEGPLRETVLGRDPADTEELCRDIERAIVANTSAKSALDCAVHDLAAARSAVPLVRFLGAVPRTMPTDVTLAVGAPAAMAETAKTRAGEGFGTLKIKVGDRGEDELDRLRRIRAAAGPGVRLRLDANQGWTAKQAIRLIRRFEDAGLDVELVEQPVPAGDLDGLARVTAAVDTPILADESVCVPADLLELIRRGAADMVNIKLAKCGGLRPARALAAMAEAAGLGVLFGSMMETHVGIGATAALAAATPGADPVPDLDAAWWLCHSPVLGGIGYQGSEITIPDAPGSGIEQVR